MIYLDKVELEKQSLPSWKIVSKSMWVFELSKGSWSANEEGKKMGLYNLNS